MKTGSLEGDLLAGIPVVLLDKFKMSAMLELAVNLMLLVNRK